MSYDTPPIGRKIRAIRFGLSLSVLTGMGWLLAGCPLYQSLEGYYQCEDEGASRSGEVCRSGYWQPIPDQDASADIFPDTSPDTDPPRDSGAPQPDDAAQDGDAAPHDIAEHNTDTTDALGDLQEERPYPEVGPRLDDLTPSGPVEISDGTTITGLHITSSDGPCIYGTDTKNVRITDNKIGPCQGGPGILIDGKFDDITIQHNHFDDLPSAIHLLSKSNRATDRVTIDHNLATNIKSEEASGQFIRLNGSLKAEVSIRCNISDQLDQELSVPSIAQHIDLDIKGKSKDEPVVIAYNKFRGAAARDDSAGIHLGAGTDYLDIHDNIILRSGKYGAFLSGSASLEFSDNMIFAPDPQPHATAGVMLELGLSSCSGQIVRGNRVYYVDQNNEPAHHKTEYSYLPCEPAGWEDENLWGDSDLSEDIWETHFPECD